MVCELFLAQIGGAFLGLDKSMLTEEALFCSVAIIELQFSRRVIY